MYNIVINGRNKQNNFFDKIAAPQIQKLIFDKNIGLKLFIKKKLSQTKNH